jgi:hypothetical protein
MKTTEDLSTDCRRDSRGRASAARFFFKGAPLWPVSGSTDILHGQVIHPEDKPLTFFLSFIFLQLRRSAKRRADVEYLNTLAWDRPKFRTAFLSWVDSIGPFSTDDKASAIRLFEEMHNFKTRSSIAIPPAADTPKSKPKR